MKIKLHSAVPLLLGLACALPHTAARASTTTSYSYSNAAQACQLSVPTIDTVVAPRANGYRNPGTTGAFVICGYGKTSGYELSLANFAFVSMDGQAHTITCTGVNGLAGESTQVYVTGTWSVPATGTNVAGWGPSSFNGTNTIPGSAHNFSITCNLPPQVAITTLSSLYTYEIGN